MGEILASFGFDAFFADQLRGLPSELCAARVVGQHRREWDIVMESGGARAVLAGKRWSPGKNAEAADAQPTVGDFVAVRLSAGEDPPVIEHVLERRSFLTRTSVAKRGARQILVANVDVVAVVAAFSHPGSDDYAAKRSLAPRRIERYLTAIHKGGAEALIVINKGDLAPDAEEIRSSLAARLGSSTVVALSCKTEGGLEPLLSAVRPGQTLGLVGMSGVGKSSIVNRLLGKDAQKIGEERASDARGRHTTTHREMFKTETGVIVIDTPGMREFALVGEDEADLSAFTDVVELAASCQFRDCRHGDEPGCAVQAAVARKELEADRVHSYRLLAKELDEAEKVKERRRPDRQRRPSPKGRRGRQTWDDD